MEFSIIDPFGQSNRIGPYGNILQLFWCLISSLIQKIEFGYPEYLPRFIRIFTQSFNYWNYSTYYSTKATKLETLKWVSLVSAVSYHPILREQFVSLSINIGWITILKSIVLFSNNSTDLLEFNFGLFLFIQPINNKI